MLEHYFTRAAVLKRHRSGLLGSHMDSFVAMVGDLGYPPKTVRRQCWVLKNLGEWMEARDLSVEDLGDEVVARYVEERGRSGGLIGSCGGGTARLFISHLQERQVILAEKAVSDVSAVSALMMQYTEYLRNERAVVDATVKNYAPSIRRFLTTRFGDGPLRLGDLRASDVSDFVLRSSRHYGPRRVQVIATALRSFSRFLFMRGDISVDLVDAVPEVRIWRQSAVPGHLSEEEIARLLGVCDRSTANGGRDYAILLLLARLGLRAREVAALELDDIDWRTGEVVIRGKGNTRDRLPLSIEVGETLATYIRRDRPTCSTRRVFIRARAPYRAIAMKGTVTALVRAAMRKADLGPKAGGPHLLRHSLAVQMLGAGASLEEIRQVLRHRLRNTTEIYAKVDFPTLRQLAQPWPVVEV